MKKIDFNIVLPDEIKKDKIFSEAKFRIDHPDLYKEYMVGSGEVESDMEIIKRWISNMLTRAINKTELDKNNIERPTQTTTMEMQCKFSRVVNALSKAKDGWVKLEDADFKFLTEKWNEAKIPCQENIALTLYAINEAIEKAKTFKGNPE